MAFNDIPPSPGVGARRKHIPKLPLSAFSGAGSTSSGQFPSMPSPSTIHPASVVDSRVYVNSPSDLTYWKSDVVTSLGPKLGGAILALPSPDSLQTVLEQIQQETITAIALSVGFPLADGAPAETPSYLSSSPHRIAISSSVDSKSITHSFIEGVKWALDAGHVVELDVKTATGDGNEGWEYLEELISKAQEETGNENKKAIIIGNVLPPPSELDLPIVKLLSHPGYLAYQTHVASLSLLSNTYLKFIPPSWPHDGSDGRLSDNHRKEWKRRVRMYLGPAIEAFGDSRILFGSSPIDTDASAQVLPSEWYSLARETVAELGVEQEGMDAIFNRNARAVYGAR